MSTTITPRVVTAGDWSHAYVDITHDGTVTSEYAGIYQTSSDAAAAADTMAGRHRDAAVVPGVPPRCRADSGSATDCQPVCTQLATSSSSWPSGATATPGSATTSSPTTRR